ncbi:hypothetical protein NQ318_010233 [Aromia moschata]|uniref:Uncharacterized protein n=1 Tax=Aromia moschata TaxID=1265417 RepID=A0AAV8YJX8_9CUCU|nr:hypothetical protein NQ318_010233 [Aromia moschata]
MFNRIFLSSENYPCKSMRVYPDFSAKGCSDQPTGPSLLQFRNQIMPLNTNQRSAPSLSVAARQELSSLYRAMQQQAFYFISRKYVHNVQQK